VVADRWLNDPEMGEMARELWCRVDFFCQTALPGYFATGLAALAAMMIVLLAPRSLPRPSDISPAFLPQTTLPAWPRGSVTRAGRWMRLVAAGGFLAAAVAGFGWGRLPGWGYVGVILLYLLGWYAEQTAPAEWMGRLRAHGPRLLSLVAAQLGLALVLAGLSGGRLAQAAAGLTLIIPLAYRLVRGERPSPAFWLISLTVVAYSIRINSWLYSVIGDEYSFFMQARSILQEDGLAGIGSQLFRGQAVYGAHPYFSSVIQAASMALLGTDNFGWRFSNAYLVALSAGLLFLFWKEFLSRRAALAAAILIAASHYLIGFSKIGYNNVQALFATSVALWATGTALRLSTPLAFAGAGLGMGLCLYVYPAGLYALPPVLLLLLVYMPPRSREAARRWGMTGVGFSLLLLPLLFQPGYWESKIAGTLLNNPEITSSARTFSNHLGSNLLYSALSYVYSPEESHFVVASYVDPLTAIFVPIGLALLLRNLRSHRFSRFVLAAALIELVLVGVTHDRRTPTATRMFLMLPWWTLLASVGLLWVLEKIGSLSQKRWPLVVALAAMVGANLYQAVAVVRQRTEGHASIEVLFLRMVQREAREDPSWEEHYLFLTEPDWGIDGVRLLRDVYGVPTSQEMLDRAVVQSPVLEPEVARTIQEDNTVVIIEPWMEEGLRLGVEDSLRLLGKELCPVSDTPETGTVFRMWLSRPYDDLCRRANLP
jgi:4-amino-4-deoxy-L-arabinose transferase-like glycosyltransferase